MASDGIELLQRRATRPERLPEGKQLLKPTIAQNVRNVCVVLQPLAEALRAQPVPQGHKDLARLRHGTVKGAVAVCVCPWSVHDTVCVPVPGVVFEVVL